MNEEKVTQTRRALFEKTWFLNVCRAAIVLTLFAGSVMVVSYAGDQQPWLDDFTLGEPSSRDVYSPFDFKVENKSLTQARRASEQSKVPNVYDVNPEIESDLVARLSTFFNEIKTIQQQPEEVRKTSNQDQLPINLSERSYRAMVNDFTPESLDSFANEVIGVGRSLQQSGIVSMSFKMSLLSNRSNIIVRQQNEEKIVEPANVTSTDDAKEQISSEVSRVFAKNRTAQRIADEILTTVIRSNLRFNRQETENRKQAAWENTEPVVDEFVRGELVVRRGEVIDSEAMSRVEVIQKKYIGLQKFNFTISVAAIVFLSLSLLIGGIFFFHRDTFTRVSELALVVFSVLFSVVLAKGVLVFTHSPLYLPVALAPALIGLLLRPRLGVLVTIFMAVMMGLLTQMNLAVIFGTLVSGIATSFTTIDVRRRAQYFRIGIVAGLMYMATVFCVSILSDEQSLQWALRTSQPAWVGGLALIPILFILLPILEHVFGLTTNVSLIELSDRNHPLLKRMALEAPGTFHHSLMVAQLAESACEEVGANGLLARVGAYFHDIGKIDKAKYFTENQNQRDRNIHDYLIPEESCSIITSHVSDGLKLAKKHKLKRCIVDFIPQHHGTALIYYFYRKAQDQSAERIEDDQLYRHIGPKPQTKETAVVLLADSAEAASRSLEDVTPEEIRSMVKKIIQHKLLDGQLDEADLTTRDLKKVEDSFTTTLLGVLHSRVKYPDLVVPSETAKANA